MIRISLAKKESPAADIHRTAGLVLNHVLDGNLLQVNSVKWVETNEVIYIQAANQNRIPSLSLDHFKSWVLSLNDQNFV